MSAADTKDESREWLMLLEQATAGDLAAFEQLMLRTQHRVFVTARRILGDSADAEEATQEVFIRVYKYLYRFDPKKPFEPWLYRLTINVCNDILSHRPPSQGGTPQEHHEIASVEIDPDELLHLDEQRRMLQSAITNLPQKQRAAVVLRDLQGLSISEVASIMKVSQATVRSHLSSARLRLKQFIEKRMRRRR
jgi:RNA polymerase sigma-70 factor (ECF subfamily)